MRSAPAGTDTSPSPCSPWPSSPSCERRPSGGKDTVDLQDDLLPLTVPEIRDYLGCDTLAYLELDRLVTATGVASRGFCSACLTGSYPVPVPEPRLDEELPSVDLVHPNG